MVKVIVKYFYYYSEYIKEFNDYKEAFKWMYWNYQEGDENGMYPYVTEVLVDGNVIYENNTQTIAHEELEKYLKSNNIDLGYL